ncbi:MAG: tannase/feruloyl esterase family alpha/beta hydrolase [Burkholderiales bacterium]|nr:tannase/feruloyl esterase family alpha/beta hydrolase [Burkholderiales bacterium]
MQLSIGMPQLAAAVSAILLAGCGGSADPTAGNASSVTRPMAMMSIPTVDPALACAGLIGQTIQPSEIGLPTSGGSVLAATLVLGTPEYCLVTGVIRPVDPLAQDITFQVDLPTHWNSKGVQFGGGGFDGSLFFTNANGNVYNQSSNVPTPLARGYVTFSSDGGHAGEPLVTAASASFALNEEMLRNYGGDAIKKVRDVANALTKFRYGKALGATYFIGGSKGGQEALVAAQWWPQDYAGVVATHPAWSFVNAFSAAMRFTQVILSPGGWLNSNKQQLVNQSVVAACDALDGVSDGVISNPNACRFDPVVLRCPDGIDSGDTCLSDVQAETVRTIAAPFLPAYSVKNGVQGYAGWPVLSGAPLGIVQFGATNQSSPNPTFGAQSLLDPLVSGFVKYFVAQNALYDQLQYDTITGSGYVDRLSKLSDWLDASDSMAPFFKQGGKLILVHGTADDTVSPQGSVELFNRIKKDVGPPVARDSMRFYMIPGFAHISSVFTLSWDPLTAIERWAEHSTPPAGLIATDAGNNGRTRPMCEYGTYPHYDGVGDVNSAASFPCVASPK